MSLRRRQSQGIGELKLVVRVAGMVHGELFENADCLVEIRHRVFRAVIPASETGRSEQQFRQFQLVVRLSTVFVNQLFE